MYMSTAVKYILKNYKKQPNNMDWLKILTEITQHIKSTIKPLIKSPIAQKTYGIVAGGDPKKHIALQAENARIKTLTEH